ncbi:hypothetical protein MYIN104542_30340 [Mycobacterium intermedium]
MAPMFMKPEELPLPELKKPDDGLVVEFPKPGAGLMSMPVNVMGSSRPSPVMWINGPTAPTGVPMLMPMKGRPMVRLGKPIEVMSRVASPMIVSRLTFNAGMVKLEVVMVGSTTSIGMVR